MTATLLVQHQDTPVVITIIIIATVTMAPQLTTCSY